MVTSQPDVTSLHENFFRQFAVLMCPYPSQKSQLRIIRSIMILIKSLSHPILLSRSLFSNQMSLNLPENEKESFEVGIRSL